MPWSARGIGEDDLPWPSLDGSFQWGSFTSALELLRSRGNTVFVLVGPFNPHFLTSGSLTRYNSARGAMEDWLEGEGIGYHSVVDLPSEWYADASHPLDEGYQEIGRTLYDSEEFTKWIDKVGRSRAQ